MNRAALLTALAGLMLIAPASAQAADIIVRYAPGTSAAQVRAQEDLDRVRGIGLARTEVVRANDPAGAIAALRARDDVQWAEPDARVYAQGSPDDPNYWRQWGLENTGQLGGTPDADIDVEFAWDATTGSPGQVVAVLDSGIDASHPDLADAIWTNPGEVGTDSQGRDRRTNGIDDDANGYVDDWRGWDFIQGDNNPTNDNHGHGTHVAGIIAARTGNGIGIAGVAGGGTRVAALRVLGDTGSGSFSGILSALAYAGRMGIPIANASLGGSTTSSQGFHDVLAAYPGLLLVAAAGNSANYLDTNPFAPCDLALANANALCVASTDTADARSSFSNWGTAAQIAAPGSFIYSTMPTFANYLGATNYAYLSGTSMATPMVAGAAALVRSADASLTTGAQLKSRVIATADAPAGLEGIVAGRARLNAARAVFDDTIAPGQPDLSQIPDYVNGDVTFAPAADSGSGVRDYGVRIGGDAMVFTTTPTASLASAAEGPVEIGVIARDRAGNTATEVTRTITLDRTAPPAPTGLGHLIEGDATVLVWSAAADTSGIAGYQVTLDGATLPRVDEPRITVDALPDGSHEMRVRAIDRAGNASPDAVWAFATGPDPVTPTEPAPEPQPAPAPSPTPAPQPAPNPTPPPPSPIPPRAVHSPPTITAATTRRRARLMAVRVRVTDADGIRSVVIRAGGRTWRTARGQIIVQVPRRPGRAVTLTITATDRTGSTSRVRITRR